MACWFQNACPATTRTQPLGGRSPATTRTQSLGGQSTWASVLPPHALKHEEDARPTTARSQSWGGPFVEYEGDHIGQSLFGWIVCSVDVKPFQCCQTNLIPILFQDCCIVESKIYTKADLIQKLCMTLLSLAIPPFRGDGQMTKKCPKFIYEYWEEISYPPSFCPFFGGIRNFFSIFICKFWTFFCHWQGKNSMYYFR